MRFPRARSGRNTTVVSVHCTVVDDQEAQFQHSKHVHVYSHDHDSVDQTEVCNYHTIIEDDVRLTYDSMVRASVRVGENSILAAKSSAQKDVPAHHIAAGSPAKSIATKPGWESVANPIDGEHEDRREQRRLEYNIPDDLERFNEFVRDLSPPDR